MIGTCTILGASSVEALSITAGRKSPNFLVAGEANKAVYRVALNGSGDAVSLPTQSDNHSFVADSRRPDIIYGIERNTPVLNVFDFRKNTARHHELEGLLLYGHACVNPLRDSLLLPARSLSEKTGVIVEWDLRQQRPIERHYLSPSTLHDCQISQSGKTILASSVGRQIHFRGQELIFGDSIHHTSVHEFSLSGGNEIRRLSHPSFDQPIAHFQQTPSGSIIALTREVVDLKWDPVGGKGEVWISDGRTDFKKVEIPDSVKAELKGEMLNACVSGKQAFITNPSSGLLLVVDIDRKVFLRSAKLMPMSLVNLEPGKLLMTNSKYFSGQPNVLSTISTSDLGAMKFQSKLSPRARLDSSHVLLY